MYSESGALAWGGTGLGRLSIRSHKPILPPRPVVSFSLQRRTAPKGRWSVRKDLPPKPAGPALWVPRRSWRSGRRLSFLASPASAPASLLRGHSRREGGGRVMALFSRWITRSSRTGRRSVPLAIVIPAGGPAGGRARARGVLVPAGAVRPWSSVLGTAGGVSSGRGERAARGRRRCLSATG